MAAAASGGVERYRAERRVGPEAEGSVGRGVRGREGEVADCSCKTLILAM